MRRRPFSSSLTEVVGVFGANLDYWSTIAPTARKELQRWHKQAHAIPAPTLRHQALKKLSSEGLNSEGAAIFALLAPRLNRGTLVRLIVAYQVMYDYLDGVNEQPAFSNLNDGLRLHRALLRAIRCDDGSAEYYGSHAERDDAGYLHNLVGACRDWLDGLPQSAAVIETLAPAVKRCGEAQAHNHAQTTEGDSQLIDWSMRHAPETGYLWWEITAAGVSSLAVHALLAAAASPQMDSREAQLVDAAYFPAICAISALLDSLIDIQSDAETASHNFAAHYLSTMQAARRHAEIVSDAESKISELERASRHKILLAGVLGYYLSTREAQTKFAQTVKQEAQDAIGNTIWPVLFAMRIRRARRAMPPIIS